MRIEENPASVRSNVPSERTPVSIRLSKYQLELTNSGLKSFGSSITPTLPERYDYVYST